MKVRIDKDECHPYFITDGKIGRKVKLAKKEIAYVKKIETEYWQLQDFLERKYNGEII